MSLNSRDRLDAAARAKGQRLGALVHAPAGHLDVLRLQRARHFGDGEVVGTHPVGIEPDIDLALPTAEHEHLADAARRSPAGGAAPCPRIR